MKQSPLFIAFSTQKGGVGKSAFSVLSASYLHYNKDYNIVVVDCDYPQHSIHKMRERDQRVVESDPQYRKMFYEQYTSLNKSAYPILCASPETAIDIANSYLASCTERVDIIFFDLPGTIHTKGVMQSISNMDYIFTPIISDRLVLESSLSFALSVNQVLVANPKINIKGVYLFWNKVDARERTDLYDVYDKAIKELGLTIMQTYVPDTKRYKKELSKEGKPVFRSTLFPCNKQMLKGSRFDDLLSEIFNIIKLEL